MEDQGTRTQPVAATADYPLRAKTPVFGHEILGGNYRTKLEANGRLVIPAALRRPFVELATARVLVVEPTLRVYTERALELTAQAAVDDNADIVPEDYGTTLFKAAPEVSVDKQARVVLPPDHRQQVGFDGEMDVVVAGSIDHLEIWSAAQWDAEQGETVRQAGLILKHRRSLPTGGV